MSEMEEQKEEQIDAAEAARRAEEIRAARERELWLRSRLDREREENLLILRYLAFQREPALLRFWRWLIDDTRSQRREERAIFAEYPGAPVEHRSWVGDWTSRLAERWGRRWRGNR